MPEKSALERKVQREIAARKAAERLLEEKSLALYNTNQHLQVALRQLELRSEQHMLKFEFEEQIDDILISFGKAFLSSPLDDILLHKFVKRLSDSPLILEANLAITASRFTRLSRHLFGQADESLLKKEKGWQKNTWFLPVRVKDEPIAVISFVVSADSIEADFISNKMSLVGELLKGALIRHLSAEREIELRRQAQESERAMREFIAMVNHEMRTPLNGVLGSAELLRGTKLDDDQSMYLQNLSQGGELLRVIINDLLDFSKIHAGMMEIVPKNFEWKQLQAALVGIFSARSAEAEIPFIVKADNLPMVLKGDTERIKQILVNLIGNAFKFTPAGTVTLQANWQDDWLTLSVTDTGIGIAENAIEQLFDPFTQADRSSKRNYEGSGLGLAICKQLTNLMGGHISCVSIVGQGSCFTVRLPLKASDVDSTSSNHSNGNSHALDGAALDILVVDDIRMNQVVIKQVLKKLGISPDVCSNGLEALEAAQGKEYDLILMDCRMPEMDGYEATQNLRELGKTLPIVALTAGTTLEERQKCLDSGMNDILTKPYTHDDVRQALEKWLG